ncbi:MAG TPA: hypothetical protein VD863_26285, partial [Bradyrhizobium sp.]|nr:hypothetical protein [Bradyrhizobium sp.]
MAAAQSTLAKGVARLHTLQRSNGSFEGEVIWCPMILAQYVLLRTFIRRPIAEAERGRMVLHFVRTQRGDGGWGLHAESQSYVFVTTLCYVALRLLGQSPDGAQTSRALQWLSAQPDGILGIPSWGKFWLSMAGLYEYPGMNPCPPEIFMLPKSSPVHPDQLYCHTRYIYLAISFLYGARFRADLGPIVAELRRELYLQPYDTIDFAKHRNTLAATDTYVPPTATLRRAWAAMAIFERCVPRLPPLRSFRARALSTCLNRIRYEQGASNFQCLSPVNGILNAIVLFANDPDDPALDRSLAGIESWRWDDATDGIRFAGARSTSWDTAFAMLA